MPYLMGIVEDVENLRSQIAQEHPEYTVEQQYEAVIRSVAPYTATSWAAAMPGSLFSNVLATMIEGSSFLSGASQVPNSGSSGLSYNTGSNLKTYHEYFNFASRATPITSMQPSMIKQALMAAVSGLAFAGPYILGQRLTWDTYDQVKGTADIEKQANLDYQISQLGRSSDSYLQSIGFDFEEISVIRQMYKDYLVRMGGSSNVFISNVTQSPSAYSSNNPLGPATNYWSAGKQVFEADDGINYISDEIASSGTDASTASYKWLSTYQNLRREGLDALSAQQQTYELLGYSIPLETAKLIYAQDLNEDETNMTAGFVSDGITSGDWYSVLQSELANQTPLDSDRLMDELDIQEMKKASVRPQPSRYASQGYTRSGPTVNSDRYNEKENENMPGVRKDFRSGKWVWANSGKPINAGRRSGYRSRRY